MRLKSSLAFSKKKNISNVLLQEVFQCCLGSNSLSVPLSALSLLKLNPVTKFPETLPWLSWIDFTPWSVAKEKTVLGSRLDLVDLENEPDLLSSHETCAVILQHKKFIPI